MLKTKIKISEINNLTDARYFAAWGVDYLGFVIHPDHPKFISPPQIKEIVEWIEGPEIVLELFPGIDPIWLDNYQEAIGDYYLQSEHKPDQPDFLVIDDLYEKTSDSESFVIYQSMENWQKQKDQIMTMLKRFPNPLYLDIPFEISDIEEILSVGLEGLVLRGGDEEKVGIKTYEELDDFFDVLRD